MKLAINFFLEFSNRPLRIIGVIGLIISMLGLFLFIFIIIAKLTGLIMAIGYASIMSTVLFIGGIQFLILSILGEYIGFINSKASNKPIYTISIDTNE